MPSTRALSARSHPQSQSQSNQTFHPVKPAPSSSSATSAKSKPSPTPSPTIKSFSPSSNHPQSSPANPVSTRARTKAAQSTTSDSASSSHSTPTKPRTRRSASSSTSKKLATLPEDSSFQSDSEGEDEEDKNRRRRNRLGGCSSQSEALDERDDSNKENIAPFLDSATASDLQREREEDVVARRTRGAQQRQEESGSTSTFSTPRAAIRRTVSSSSSSSVMSSSSSSSSSSRGRNGAASVNGRDNLFSSGPEHQAQPQRRGRGRPSLPQSIGRSGSSSSGTVRSSSSSNDNHDATPQQEGSRKRSRRGAAPSSSDTSTSSSGGASSPLSRLHLDSDDGNITPNGNGSVGMDDGESYFSSQTSTVAGSIFDSASQEDSSSTYAFTRGTTESRSSSPGTEITEGEGPKEQENDSVDTLMSDPVVEQEQDSEPSTTSIFRRFTNVYAHARSLLRYASGVNSSSSHSSSTEAEVEVETEVSVVGRHTERLLLETFLHKKFSIFPHVEQSQVSTMELDEDELDVDEEEKGTGCLYVCGLPGTGKTALIRSIISDLQKSASSNESHVPIPRSVFVNCMTVAHPRLIFAEILNALGEEPVKHAKDGQVEIEAEKRVNDIVKKSKDSNGLLIVLDEIDHLLHSRAHQNVLYRLFALSSPNSACGLIGIANSLDLTERFVPLLQSKGAAPELIHFRPFDAKEIVTVIKSRLEGLFDCYDGSEESNSTIHSSDGLPNNSNVNSPLPLFSPAALDLAAKKIAAVTGDLRKALDACRLAVELVEMEQRTKASDVTSLPPNSSLNEKVSTNEALDSSKLLSHLTPSSAPKVMPPHILKVLSQVLGSPQLNKVRDLPLHAKLLLLAFLVCQKRASEGLSVLGSAGGTTLGSSSIKSKTGQNSPSALGKIRIADLILTYSHVLNEEGSFNPLENSELLAVIDLLEVQGLFTLDSEAVNSPTSSDHLKATPSSNSNGVSPGGKRASKKQLLASNKIASLNIPLENVLKGITTAAPASASNPASSSTITSTHSSLIPNLINRIWIGEEDRIIRSRNWESENKEKERVRREELGGGRGAVGV